MLRHWKEILSCTENSERFLTGHKVKVECLLTLPNLMLSKSRDLCAPKAWKKCKKEDVGSKKPVLEQKKIDYKHFVVSAFASNVEYWMWFKIFSCPKLVAYKKERNSETFSFWQIHNWKGSILCQGQLCEKLKKMYVQERW